MVKPLNTLATTYQHAETSDTLATTWEHAYSDMIKPLGILTL